MGRLFTAAIKKCVGQWSEAGLNVDGQTPGPFHFFSSMIYLFENPKTLDYQ